MVKIKTIESTSEVTGSVEEKIYFIRNFRVILDSDIAEIYGVSTKRLNEQVKRNADRFPSDFMFTLSQNEYEILKSQNATSSWGGRRNLPRAFTEHGALMLASVLNSPIAIQASIQVVRAFLYLRKLNESNKDFAENLIRLEYLIGEHELDINTLFEAVRLLMNPAQTERKRIGFKE